MKTTLCFTLTLLTFTMLASVPNSFAQDTSRKYIVRQIYFYPNDLDPLENIDATLDKWVEHVQQFYTDEMERHGFGRKTFRLETDAQGNPVRHYVKGKFTNEHYAKDLINKASKEIGEQFDLGEHLIDLIFFRYDQPGKYAFAQVGGNASGHSFGGKANIILLNFDDKAPKSLYARAWTVTAHELGHAFGLKHDFRDDQYVMSGGSYELESRLSYCAAEWLSVSRYFNTTQNVFDQEPSVEMLEPTFVSSPNTIRFRFEITHSARLHQAQLLTNSLVSFSLFDPTTVIDCKSLNTNSTTVEFVTTELAPISEYVRLRVIDVHGNFNFTDQRFPINMTALLSDSKSEPVSIPDKNLAALIRKTLGLQSTSPITKLDMLGLGDLHFYEDNRNHSGLRPPPGKEITDLTGLQHATNLERLYLNDHRIVDLTPLAGLTKLRSLILSRNQISDVSPVEGLTLLSELWLDQNQISDITPLARLTRLTSLLLGGNKIADITPLAGLMNLRILNIGWNQINDEMLTQLAALTEFPKLNSLSLGGSKIRDLTPLTKLTRIERLSFLDLEANQIVDITPLEGMTDLRMLFLPENQISDITPLKGMMNLGVLYLRENQISDVSPLSDLVNLDSLNLVGNPIKNRKPLFALLRKNPNVEIWLKHGDKPLPVTLSHFRAEHTDAGVVINWTTESEINNAGFYIYRSETKDSEFKVVNPTMIQGAGTTSERNTYTWTDTTAKPNTVYYYRIEDVSHAAVRKQLATVRLRGLVSANGKFTTTWADLKMLH